MTAVRPESLQHSPLRAVPPAGSAAGRVDPAPSPLTVRLAGHWLTVRLDRPHLVAGWALVGGGLREAATVAWHRVAESELRPPVRAEALLKRRLAEQGLHNAVALLTSRRLDAYTDATAHAGGVAARCIATVGMGNALRVGDPPGPAGRIGTINLLCAVSQPLLPSALLEALGIASEARTVAVLAGGVPSRLSGRPATGTGTDCIVIAAPCGEPAMPFAGKHTAPGSAVGQAVETAVAQGLQQWLADHYGAAGGTP